MSDHEALRILTSRQHGVVSRRQLADLGFSSHAVIHAVASGSLRRVNDRVLVLCGSADTLLQRTMAAALDVSNGAVALHSAAAMWHGPGFRVEPVHVLTDRRPHRGSPHLGVVHSTVRWTSDEATTLDGVPVTTPLRTLRDLAGRVHPDLLSRTCDRWLSTHLLRLTQLHALAADLPRRGGAAGTRAMRELIGQRPPGYRPAESNLERRFEKILADAGETPFERQVDLGDDEGWIGRVDFVDRTDRIVVEVQSDLFHSGLLDRARDRERIRRLRRAGWIVVEITEHEVWHRREVVVAKVRAARSRRRAA